MTSQSSVAEAARVTGSLAAVFGAEDIDAINIDATTNIDDAHSAGQHAETPGSVAAAIEKLEMSTAKGKAVEQDANDSDDLREQVTEQTEKSEVKPVASVGTAGRQIAPRSPQYSPRCPKIAPS